MAKEYKHDNVYLLRWKGKELECIRIHVTRRVRVINADTKEEFNLITGVDNIGRRYTNLGKGLYINLDDNTYTYRLDKWEYELINAKLYEKDELVIALNEIENSVDEMIHGLFKTKYCIEKIRSLEVLWWNRPERVYFILLKIQKHSFKKRVSRILLNILRTEIKINGKYKNEKWKMQNAKFKIRK